MEYEYNDDTVLHIIRLLGEEYDSIKAEDSDLLHKILFVTPEILTRIPQELESEKYKISVYDNETAIKDRFDYSGEYVPKDEVKELNIIHLESCPNKEHYMTLIQKRLTFELRNQENIYVFLNDEFNYLSSYPHRENMGDNILDLTSSNNDAKYLIQDHGDKLLLE